MLNDNNTQFKLTITQDKLVDILMHAATREDIAKLDTKIDNLETKLDTKISKLDDKIDSVEARLDDKISKLDDKISKLDDKIDNVEARLDTKISKLDDKIDNVEARLNAKLDKLIWGVFFAILVPIAIQFFSHYFK